MVKTDKIAVFGSNGMVGSAIIRKLKKEEYTNILQIDLDQCNLKRQDDVESLFKRERPEYVFVAAAKVGGIIANSTYPAEFIYDNLMIQSNIIHSAHVYCVKKLLFLGSSCIYPKMAPQPIKEKSLLTGPLEPSNEAYAIAKIAGLKMCNHYQTQYGDNFISAMPTNLYGYGDNFNAKNSHVIPGLMRRLHEATLNSYNSIKCWGSGKPTREFLFVDDLAEALIFMMNKFDGPGFLNIGTGVEISIRDLVELIADIVGYDRKILWDKSKPDGTPRKVVDTTKINNLGWKYKTNLRNGLQLTYDWFLKNQDMIRF